MTDYETRSYHPPEGYMLVPAEGYPPVDKDEVYQEILGHDSDTKP